MRPKILRPKAFGLVGSDVKKDWILKAKARTKDWAPKAKAKDWTPKAKARTKDWTLKAKARTKDLTETCQRTLQGLHVYTF